MHPETHPRLPIADRGSVVVEAALVIPVLLVVTVLLVWVTSLGATYVRVLDVAQTAARQVARGGEQTSPPQGMDVSVGWRDGLAHVVASEQASPPLLAFTGWSVTVRAEAHAAPEWTIDTADPIAEVAR